MPKKYMIRDGFTFRGDDGKVAAGGDTIDLEDDVAQLHLHKLEPVDERPKRKSEPKGQATGTDPAGSDPSAQQL
jgi:hypothetical protein